jgi:hypothetical protein
MDLTSININIFKAMNHSFKTRSSSRVDLELGAEIEPD